MLNPETDESRPPEMTAVLILAHGSRHGPANDDCRALAARLEQRGVFPIAEPGFLELAAPDIPNAGLRCVQRGATRVLILPYFLSAGVHLLRDLTAARAALSLAHPQVTFDLGGPLGPHPLLDELVLERARNLREHGDDPVIAQFSSAEMAQRYAPLS